MPWKEHPSFPAPSGNKLWRYMTFTKYLALLRKRAVFFCRVGVLAESDPYEGLYGAANLRLEEITYEQIPTRYKAKPPFDSAEHYEMHRTAVKRIREWSKQSRDQIVVSCWHLGEYESAAMWAHYGTHEAAVAVITTIERLKRAFQPVSHDLYFGAVQYIDYSATAIPIGNVYNPVMHKRRSFEHEREVRVVISNEISKLQTEYEANSAGIFVPAVLDELIEEVRVNPNAPDWHREIIEDVTRRYDVIVPVVQSDISLFSLY